MGYCSAASALNNVVPTAKHTQHQGMIIIIIDEFQSMTGSRITY
jgi:hypothetical protein